MAKGDIISRLKLESGEFDSKIKRAGQELMAYSEHCKKTGLQMGYANKDAKEFAKALGSMTTVSTTARGKVNELSEAFVNLKSMYNQMTDAEKKGEFGRTLSASLDQLKQRTMEAKKELNDITKELQSSGNGGGGLFGGGKMDGMLQVFGGNLMTKAAGMLTTELMGTVQQSVELARAGEGIRMAFERLNRPGLLDNLKEATHGTVSELDLMKQAVKFDNFKLSLDQMGTFLAFAQQQAKDTGQSVDYMVDSIVTGLGRKSLPILDNLGLSASDIRERMKETGDMTSAVAQIIQERMDAAGGYVETAADRAARATAQAQDKAEEFGRTAMPIAQEWEETWATLKSGAMSFANTLLGPVAESIRSIQGVLNGDAADPIGRTIERMEREEQQKRDKEKRDSILRQSLLPRMPGGYVEVTDKNGNVLHGGHFDNEEQKQALLSSWNTTRTTGGRTRTTGMSLGESLMDSLLKAQRGIDVNALKEDASAPWSPSSAWKMLSQQHYATLQPERRMSKAEWDEGQQRGKENIENNYGGIEEWEKQMKKQLSVMDAIGGNVGNIMSGIQQMGIKIPDGISQLINGFQTIISMVSSIVSLVAIISSISAVKATPVIGWLLAGGGIAGGLRGRAPLHAAGGIMVPGNNMSGDMVPAMLNSGELVLNRAQQGNIASQLQGGMQHGKLEAVVTGEQLRFVLNTNSLRRGKGEYVTSTHM